MKIPESIPQKLQYCWQHEKEKFAEMGNYKYYSLFLFAFQFTVMPELLRIIWPYVQGSMDDVVFYSLIVLFLNVYTIVLYNAVMYFIYTCKWSFFEQFRADPNQPWPWEKNDDKWPAFLRKTLALVTFNVLLSVVVLYVDSSISFHIQMKAEDFPSRLTIFWQFMFFLYMEELIFYTAHRLFHYPQLYFLHKTHHEYNVSIALTFVYNHPIDQLSNVIATGLAYKLLSEVYPVHIFTVIIWLNFRLMETMDGHCGYDWPWAIANWVPFSAGGRYHFFHHSNNVGNYGGIVHIFDTLLGTNQAYLRYQAKQQAKKSSLKSS